MYDLLDCKFDFLVNENGPLVVYPKAVKSSVEWIKINQTAFAQTLSQCGAILLRNFLTSSLSDFELFVTNVSEQSLSYTYRSTPRHELGKNIYTATEYPANRIIPLHNENSYSRHWPKKILFHCLIAAKTGGETPIADSRQIYNALNKNIVEKFVNHNVCYVRNYSNMIDLSWQEVFQTEDKNVVADYCKKNGIDYCWLEGLIQLRTKEYSPAILEYPQTGEKLWFNQAHLFHPASLPSQTRQMLRMEFGEECLPRNVYYGDGSSIEDATIEYINEVYQQHSIPIRWQEGDILILDNLLYAHGRNSFTGDRKIAVAMTQ